MPTIVDKSGNKKEVNAFIAGNAQLLKKYGYTLLGVLPKAVPGVKTEEKKSVSPAAADKPLGSDSPGHDTL